MKILERATSDWNPFLHFLIYARNARFEIFWTNCTYIHMYVCACIYPTCLERFDAILEIQEGSLTGCASGANQQVL